jgi:hypothetical protein
MVRVEDFPHHSERAFCHSIQQHAKRFFGRNFFACTGIPFPKIASTFFAEKPLLSCHNTAFHYLPGSAFLHIGIFPSPSFQMRVFCQKYIFKSTLSYKTWDLPSLRNVTPFVFEKTIFVVRQVAGDFAGFDADASEIEKKY